MTRSSAIPEDDPLQSTPSQPFQEINPEPIAVVGIGLKFPQDADTIEGFWDLLTAGRATVTDVPKDRWNVDSYYHPNADRNDTMNSRRGHFLKEDVSLFDAPFFSIPYAEAVCMDPQQRSLLECTYHALENAGIPLASIVGTRTSCYVGSFSKEYGTLISRDTQLDAKYMAVGIGTAMLSNRLSWFYDLRGPSISLDTACSSSLIALNLAVQSIRSGESDMSLVAGCNLMLNPETNSIPLSNAGFLGPDGICYSFDHRANGYARGEGTAVLALKPLSKAVQDGDTIRAVIRNSGANTDGRTPGITQPSREAQAELIRETYREANLPLNETRFFEAHGTGTPVGDPREAGSIADVFKSHRSATDPLIVGAVKSNIGHLEGASGLAGLIKAICILETGIIPGNAFLERLNPQIPANEWNLKFPPYTMIWPKEGLRRASVNSFGYGGSNAHVILDDAYHYLKSHGLDGKHQTVPHPPKSLLSGQSEVMANGTCDDQYRVFVWSTNDEKGIERVTDQFRSHLTGNLHLTQDYLQKLAYTLSDRRTHLPWKAFMVASSPDELKNGLNSNFISTPVRSSVGLEPYLALVFTGQGAQWIGMGRELTIYPAFMASLRHAEKVLSSLGCDWKVTDVLLRADDQTFFNDARVTQPLCTILQVALVDLLTLWELKPMAVVGHSSGEIAAAYCAGALSKASAYKVAYFRGALSSELSRFKHSKGSMLAVALSEYNVQVYLDEVSSLWGSGRLVVGCVNSPQNVTLSGEEICIDFIKGRLDEDNVFVRKLQVPVAYHSTQMEKVSEKYTTLIQDISAPSRSKSDVAPPTFFSSVKGEAIDVTELSSPQYWARNMVSQVKFGSALTALLGSLSQEKPGQTDNASVVLVEVGPHSALRRPVHETMEGGTYSAEIFYESLLRINTNASKAALELIGKLHCYGFQTKIAAANEPLWPIPASNLQPLVDLPSYPFDHSQSYWLESRISRNFRFAEVPRHELLGSRTVEWNALDARWRNTIRFSELPWIQDHCFNGTMLYPAAGILVMAIEAARQLANPDLHNDVVLTGYSFESVSFHRPLLVNLTSEGVETQFSLRPTGRKVPRSDRYTFHLYQATQDGWAVICDGTISTEYGRKGERESDENVFPQDDWLPVARRCKQNVDPRDAYENLATYGFAFGPTFQALSNIQHNQIKEATAILDPRQWLEKVEPGQAGADHVIHPTSLDAFMHLAAIAESDGSWTPIPTLVPSKLEQLWISNDLLSHNPGQRLQVLTRPTFHGYRDYESSSAAYDTQTKRCQIFQQGYRFTTITELEPLDSSERPFAYDVSWKPDIDLLSENELATVCENAASKSSDKYDLAILDHVELLCLSYMRDACQKLDQIGFAGDTKQSTRYIAWMKKMIQEHEAQTFSTDCQHAEIPSAAVSLAEIISRGGGGPEMDLMQMVGEDLPRLLTGETDVLELLFGDDNRAEAFYQGDGWAMITAKVAAYIDLVAHRDPQIQILEVGAGTGGCTAAILDELAICSNGETGRPRIGKYTYTDISPSFFDSASQRFHKYTDQMDFRVFDMEKDPLSQGYDLNSYDVIVAHAAVHATSNIESSLRHLQSLLKPNGKIVISEPCNLNRARVPFVFGLLPGWWLGTEEYRFWTPLLSEERWDYEFRKAGFGGTELCLKDFDGNNHTASVLVSSKLMPSTAVDTEEPHPSPVINQFLVVVADQNGLGHPLVSALKSSIEPLEIQTETCVYSSLSSRDLEGTFVISLLELEKPFLVDIGEDDWEVLQTIVRSVSGIMWITKGREENAELGMVTGLLRVLLSEYPHLQFLEFALEATSTNVSAADNFYKILRKSLRSGSLDKKECEYEERSGIVHVSRLVESKHLNNHMDSRMNVQRPQTRELGLPSTGNLSLSIRKPGFLDSLFFQEAATCKTRDLQGDQVEVEVKAVGLGFRDCLIAQGQLPASSMGLEFAGVITAIGPDVSETEFSPGDSVCGLSLGAFSTTICTRATLLLRVPENMSFSEAASGVLGCTLAYHSLVTLANLKRGEKVLIHSGAGAVGQMALQIANDIEVEVYTTVGNEDKKTFITSAFGVSEDRVIVGRGVSLVPELEKLSGTMDVVLNSLTGEGLRHSLKCLCPFGRLIDISVQDNRALGDLPGSLFTSGITYSKVDLTLMLDHPNVAFKETLAAVQRMILDGNASPFPTAAFSASHIEAAFSTIYEAESPGKVVVELGRGDSVSVVPSTAQSLYFRADSSYVIAGGLGGIGKSTVKWMADRGARYLIILSRSGAKEASAIDLIEELGEHGVVVAAPKCDITDRDFLSSVLNECAQSMPPIRGCIQGAMVLEDTIFDSMSVADFHKAVRPKVQGSWNLHNLLPSDLDFFIMLSSAGGIMGTRGQSNYASGSTYQDSLARYRASHGLTAASVDLGLIRGVGFAAEHRDSLISISKVRFRSISEKEYLAMMEHLCEPQRNIANEPLLSQVVTGVELPEFLKSGKDRESGSEDDKDSSWAWMRWVSRPMFSSLGAQKEHKSQNARTRNKSGGEYDTSIEFREQFAAIKHSQAEAANLVAKTLKSKLTRTLRMPEEDIETQKNVFYYGVDSLVAVDLRHWISNDMKASLSVFEIMESTIGSLSWQIVERSEL